MTSISTCLWFADEAEEAARFYVSLFPGSRVGSVSRYGEGAPLPAGTALMVEFELAGRGFQALNGASGVPFTDAVSISVQLDTQDEVDEVWERLTSDGGEPGRCGWLTDRYGVSWQVVPAELAALMSDPDEERVGRVVQALLAMSRISVPELRRAADG